MSKKTLFACVLLCAGGFSCSAAPTDPNADPNGDPAAQGEEELKGSSCGGFANKPCPGGYDCKLSGKCCDLPGVCVKKVCVQNVICAIDSHFDRHLCKCVHN